MPLNIASASITLTLPGNALVRSLKVWVQADAAGSVVVKDVGQVRAQSSAVVGNSSGTSVVVDFGTTLTVGGAAAPVILGKSYKLYTAYKWQGAAFDFDHPIFPPNANGLASVTFSEVSTSRVQLELVGPVPAGDAVQATVQLPSVPADLEVHVNDGPVAWKYPGPRGTPPADGWEMDSTNTYTQHEVDLTSVVAPMVGNPDNWAPVQVTVELRARVPGRLAVLFKELTYDLVERVPVVPDPDLVFDEEGEQLISFNTPVGAGTPLKEVWVTLLATPPKERAVPAVGPQRVPEVALLLDSGRSAAVRFPANQLGELTGLRLPLSGQGGTAEVRAELLSPVGNQSADEPGPPLEGAAATKPVQLPPSPIPKRGVGLEAEPQLPDTWVLLPFEKPVKIEGAVWIQLQVTRGTVRWSLGQYALEDGAPYPVRRGAPTGPWLPLPAAVTAMPNLGGRLHAIGHPTKASPLAPVRLQVVKDAYASPLTDVTPTAKGVTVKLQGIDPGVSSSLAKLRVISRAATTVTVQSLYRVVQKP